MSSSLQFQLNQDQAEYIQSQLPKGYSIQIASLIQSREQRISKKVSKYDASFQSLPKDSPQLEELKRPQRTLSNQKEPPTNDIVKKGLIKLQKFQNHPAFNEVYSSISGYFNIDQIEATFVQGGNTAVLWQDLRKMFKLASQLPNLYDQTSELEAYFNDLFKNYAQPTKKAQNNINNNNKKADIPMTYQEKTQLSVNIRALPNEHLLGVWNIVQGVVKAEDNGELEFDIENLPVRVARQLEQYVASKLNQKKVKMDTGPNKQHGNLDSSFPSESSN